MNLYCEYSNYEYFCIIVATYTVHVCVDSVYYHVIVRMIGTFQYLQVNEKSCRLRMGDISDLLIIMHI